MTAGFDIAASEYDETFTHSVIGSTQRQLVYRHLIKILKDNPPRTILEINCGTGEDAIWLARQNYSVTATDISEKMISIAKQKEKLQNLNFLIADINKLPIQFSGYCFDMIFSNFGGLNCLSKAELEVFFRNASELLSERGRLILVIMPKNTLWEKIYFFFKANVRDMNRRKNEMALSNVNGEMIPTYYHNPQQTASLASEYFIKKQLKPIGFFIPPSYLEPFFGSKRNLMSALEWLEKRITNKSCLAKYADHYLIVLQKK